jgi:hypothetical protein
MIYVKTHSHTQTQYRILVSLKGNYAICKKIDRIGYHHVKQNKPEKEKQRPHVFSDM